MPLACPTLHEMSQIPERSDAVYWPLLLCADGASILSSRLGSLLVMAPTWSGWCRASKLVQHRCSKHPTPIQVASKRFDPWQYSCGVVDTVVWRVPSGLCPWLSGIPNAPRWGWAGGRGFVWLGRPESLSNRCCSRPQCLL